MFSVHGLRMNEIEGHGASGDLQGSGESAMMTPWEVQRAMKFQEGLRVGRGWAGIGDGCFEARARGGFEI